MFSKPFGRFFLFLCLIKTCLVSYSAAAPYVFQPFRPLFSLFLSPKNLSGFIFRGRTLCFPTLSAAFLSLYNSSKTYLASYSAAASHAFQTLRPLFLSIIQNQQIQKYNIHQFSISSSITAHKSKALF